MQTELKPKMYSLWLKAESRTTLRSNIAKVFAPGPLRPRSICQGEGRKEMTRQTGFAIAMWVRGRIKVFNLHEFLVATSNADVCSLDGQSSIIREFRAGAKLLASGPSQSQPVLICKDSEIADENWLKMTEATLEQP